MLLLKFLYLLTHAQDNLLYLVHVSAFPFFMVRISEAGKEGFVPATNRWRESREAEWIKSVLASNVGFSLSVCHKHNCVQIQLLG